MNGVGFGGTPFAVAAFMTSDHLHYLISHRYWSLVLGHKPRTAAEGALVIAHMLFDLDWRLRR